MNEDQIIAWHASWAAAADIIAAKAVAAADALMTELGYYRGPDGMWAPVPAIPWQRRILHVIPFIPRQRDN
jgi:hypothetical protein